MSNSGLLRKVLPSVKKPTQIEWTDIKTKVELQHRLAAMLVYSQIINVRPKELFS